MPRRAVPKRSIDLDVTDNDGDTNTPQRRSKRTTRFSSSFKEPNDSINEELIVERSTRSVSKKRKSDERKMSISSNVTSASSSPDDNDEEEQEEEEEEEQERSVKRRTSSRIRSNSMSRATSQASSVLSTPLAEKDNRRAQKCAKSPAVRHSSTRRKIHLEEQDEDESKDDDDEDDSEEESSDSSDEMDEEEELEPVKIQRIIAVRMETKRKWLEICRKMNTSEIENGSRWFQEEIPEEELDKYEERFLVKWADLSFLHCSWEKKDDLMEQVENPKTYLTMFFRKSDHGYYYSPDERMDGEYFDPGFVQIERILDISPPDGWSEKRKRLKGEDNDWGMIYDPSHPDYENGTGRVFLVKWLNTAYSDATYEYERDLILMDVEYECYLDDFQERNKKPTKLAMKKIFSLQEAGKRRLYKIFGDHLKDDMKEKRIEEYKKKLEEIEFRNGGKLRDYQAEGVSWLLANHINHRSAILADEMGLGKTIQTATYLEMLNNELHLRGPFLIVAPLSTIPHWQREFSGWTGLNTIVYHGTLNDRKVIREFEFPFECDRPQGQLGINQRYLNKCHKKNSSKAERLWMAQVVITTPEMLVTDDFNELTAVEWELLVVDEAHRLKSHTSKLAVNLRDCRFTFNHTLLLTGTPIQNNMNELWALMSIVDPDEFNSCEEFMSRYDNMQSKDRVDELHGVIRPYILRRLKEDVEKSVPPKEETLIEVELTVLQKKYYRALYEKNVEFLHRDVKKPLDGPSLNNLSMQLRKCCNHPFLLEGVEESAKKGVELNTHQDEADFLTKSSGKLVLLDKLLPKLREGGHRVLIFSQFKIMLNIIEDYMSLREFKYERIDGSITGKKRQMAIDRFQSKSFENAPFVMLLSTRAGGVGINLTAADTCIIFDSDWNPQNDLQAQARCHRIGQTKSVKVYRLLTRKTYEMQMFHMSSLKMGLDQAVLQGIENGGVGEDGNNMTKEEVEKLLRFGAYDIFKDENDGTAEKESNEFIELDIDTILARRSKTVIHDSTCAMMSNSGGSTFSKATFKALGASDSSEDKHSHKDIDIDDPDFWKKMIGDTKTDQIEVPSPQKKRISKKTVSYNEKLLHDILYEKLDESDASTVVEDEEEEDFDEGLQIQKEVDEFNFTSHLKNENLQKLMEHQKRYLAMMERKRWGGKGNNEWSKADVSILIKNLLRYGYGNIPWDNFHSQFQKEVSKSYDEIEMIRMCWSLCFSAIVESTQQGKLQRNKVKNKKTRDSEAPEAQTKEKDICKMDNHRMSFERYWSSNPWIAFAFSDAKKFADNRNPRNFPPLSSENSSENKVSGLRDAFKESILPALKNRGWIEHTSSSNSKKRAFYSAPDGAEYFSIAEIFDHLPSLHPELEESMNSIIASLCEKASNDENTFSKRSFSDGYEIEHMTKDKLSMLVKEYGSYQLVISLESAKKLNLHSRHMLLNLTYTHAAHVCVGRARDTTGRSIDFMKLSKILNPNPKSSIPHPRWQPIHDAVLVSAISKHGWIDRDKVCREIIDDDKIKWGAPFDNICTVTHDQTPNRRKKSKRFDNGVRDVAGRVARFLNDEKECIKDFKGFNLNLILETYCISNVQKYDNDMSYEWEVDYEELQKMQIASNDKNNNFDALDAQFEPIDLPPRKDLLRRAKLLLSKPLSIYKTTEKMVSVVSHDFGVLDQSNICNFFLAELLREAIKVGQKRQSWIERLLTVAHGEADIRSNECIEGSNESMELLKISKHISLTKQNCKPFGRAAKNVIRAILGIEVHQPKKSNETTFVEETKHREKNIATSTTKTYVIANNQITSVIDHKKTLIQNTAGDEAVNTALFIGKQSRRNESIPNASYIKLTSIETLILSVLCSQGVPVWQENWHESLGMECTQLGSYHLTWNEVASILEGAAEVWHDMISRNVACHKETTDVTQSLFSEQENRRLVLAEATSLRNEPVKLARKAIMLLEAVRIHGVSTLRGGHKKDFTLGSKVLNWSASNMIKWAQCLGVFVNGKIVSQYAIDLRPDIIPSAFFSDSGCLTVFSQICQQTRLRSLQLKYSEDEFMNKILPKAVKKCDSYRNEWVNRPWWWSAKYKDDERLVSGILMYGYGGFDTMVKRDNRFSSMEGKHNSNFYRFTAQVRLDTLTRELSSVDDRTEAMKLINDRKQNVLDARLDLDRTTRCLNRQVEIDSFFSRRGDSKINNCSNSSNIER